MRLSRDKTAKKLRTEIVPHGERHNGKVLKAITLQADLPKFCRRVRWRSVITTHGIIHLCERTCLKW